MVFVLTLSVLFLLLILTLIYKHIKSKKNIGQKISFLYNQLYIILIIGYYKNNSNKKKVLKEELLDYYKEVVVNKKIDSKNKNGQEIKGFVMQYYMDNNQKIAYIYDVIDMYYTRYYSSMNASIGKLMYLMLFIIVFIAWILFKLK